MKTIVAAYKVSDKVFSKNSDNIADAMFQKAAYGSQSEYLTHSSLREIKKMKGSDLLDLFKSLSRLECSIVYSGQLSASVVAEAIRHSLPVDKATMAVKEERRIPQNVSEPVIYFYNLPSARQSIIQTYQSVKPCPSAQEKARFMLWGSYFGHGFSSLLFQEIRELRAYAYYAYGNCLMPSAKYTSDPTAYMRCLIVIMTKLFTDWGNINPMI
jgi:Predicted Zn-dependent peptidases